MGVKERIKAFADAKGVSYKELSLKMGATAGYINSISKSIQPDKINRISALYPDLSIDWLLTGEGSMLRDVAEAVNAGSVVAGRDMQNSGNHTVNNAAPDDLVAALAKSQEQIDRLLGIIERMQQQPEKE